MFSDVTKNAQKIWETHKSVQILAAYLNFARYKKFQAQGDDIFGILGKSAWADILHTEAEVPYMMAYKVIPKIYKTRVEFREWAKKYEAQKHFEELSPSGKWQSLNGVTWG